MMSWVSSLPCRAALKVDLFVGRLLVLHRCTIDDGLRGKLVLYVGTTMCLVSVVGVWSIKSLCL